MLTLKILFWVCLFIVFYTYIGYGILLYIIIRVKRLCCGKPQETVLPADDQLPTMTLMICAYNEEDVVAEKMENTLALDYPRETNCLPPIPKWISCSAPNGAVRPLP